MSACILCGVDGSSEAARAASVASRLARDLHSRALLVHVSEGARRLPFGLHLPWLGRAPKTRKRMKAIAEECCFPRGTEVRLKAGDPAAELLAIAEEEDADLLVVSSGGTGHAGPALLDGTTIALMRSSSCPVVVVPPRVIPPLDSEGIRRIVCGVDGSDGDLRRLRLAADLAGRLGGDLHAVHAYEPGVEPHESAERRMAFALAEAGVRARAHVLPQPAYEALERVARQEGAGLTVVGPPGAGRTGPVPRGFVTSRLAAEGGTALVVPQRAAA
jgi:nucleotide-binding universal stress UspA family protein